MTTKVRQLAPDDLMHVVFAPVSDFRRQSFLDEQSIILYNDKCADTLRNLRRSICGDFGQAPCSLSAGREVVPESPPESAHAWKRFDVEAWSPR